MLHRPRRQLERPDGGATDGPATGGGHVEWSRVKFCDVVNLFLGTILFFSPWLFSLSPGTPRQTAAIAGL